MREPWQDERPTTAHHKVEHKWSAWSADRDTWLEYEGGAGKDRYDSRAGENLPYFRTLGELGAFFVANPGKPAQIDTRTGLYDGDE